MGFGRRFRRAVRRVTRRVSRVVREVSRGVSRVGREVGHGVERVGREAMRAAQNPLVGALIGGALAPVTGGMSLGAMAGAGLAGAAKGYLASSALGSLSGGGSSGSVGSASEDLATLSKKSDAEAELEKERALSQTNLRRKYGSAYGSGYTSRWGKVIK